MLNCCCCCVLKLARFRFLELIMGTRKEATSGRVKRGWLLSARLCYSLKEYWEKLRRRWPSVRTLGTFPGASRKIWFCPDCLLHLFSRLNSTGYLWQTKRIPQLNVSKYLYGQIGGRYTPCQFNHSSQANWEYTTTGNGTVALTFRLRSRLQLQEAQLRWIWIPVHIDA